MPRLFVPLVIMTAACGDDVPQCETDACSGETTDNETTDGEPMDTETSDGETTDGGPTGTDTNGEGGSETDTDLEPVCGNGIVESDEPCDDGNLSDTDACLNSCMSASCGDGHVHEGVEACDDGNDDDADECLSDCTLSQLPQVGDACDINYLFQCVPDLEASSGTPLLCDEGVLTETDEFAQACAGLCLNDAHIPVEACGGWGEYAICLCVAQMPEPCDEAQLGCQGPDMLALCHEGEVAIGDCPGCAMVDGYFTCDW